MSDEAWARLQQVYADRDPGRRFVGYLGDSNNRNHWAVVPLRFPRLWG